MTETSVPLCRRGHPQTDDNVYVRKSGKLAGRRDCRLCSLERAAKRAPKKRKSPVSTGPKMTRERLLMIEVLREQGPLVDANGRATERLVAALGERGHDATTRGTTGLIHRAEREGIVEREVRGKRTFRIALTPDYLEADGDAFDAMTKAEVTEARKEPEPVPAGIDYGRLADAVLAKAVEAITRPAPAAQDLAERERLIRDRVSTEVRALGAERDTALKMAEEQELAATTFRARCEELAGEVERLKIVVRKYREDEQARRNGYPVREHLDDSSRRALDEVLRDMSKIPSYR